MLKNEPVKIIIHHTADPFEGSQFAKINEYHRQKYGCASSFGYFIGYHFIIERDGTIKKARSDHDEGCHTIGSNADSIGIGLAGNFDIQQPTSKQRESLGQLCYELSQKYSIPIERIIGHRTYSVTSCPGYNLPDEYARIYVLQHQLTLIQKILYKLLTWVEKLFSK